MKKEHILEVTILLSALEGNFKYRSPNDTFMLVGMGLIEPLNEIFDEYEDSDESKQWSLAKQNIDKSQKIMNLSENWKDFSGREPEWRKIVDEVLFPPFSGFMDWWFCKHPEFDNIKNSK